MILNIMIVTIFTVPCKIIVPAIWQGDEARDDPAPEDSGEFFTHLIPVESVRFHRTPEDEKGCFSRTLDFDTRKGPLCGETSLLT
jgi:hypothetical protein